MTARRKVTPKGRAPADGKTKRPRRKPAAGAEPKTPRPKADVDVYGKRIDSARAQAYAEKYRDKMALVWVPAIRSKETSPALDKIFQASEDILEGVYQGTLAGNGPFWLSTLHMLGPAAIVESCASILAAGGLESYGPNALTALGSLVSDRLRRGVFLYVAAKLNWRLAAIARQFGVGTTAAPVLRLIRSLGVEDAYERAKRSAKSPLKPSEE